MPSLNSFLTHLFSGEGGGGGKQRGSSSALLRSEVFVFLLLDTHTHYSELLTMSPISSGRTSVERASGD